MSKFSIQSIHDPDDNPFDRQERISWWSQEKLKAAKVMVVGAGAIGNETLKNLALLGIGNIFITDFDTISTSNLSRTVLFRKEDKGLKKAELAAKRVREMSLLEDVRVDWFDGDVVWELGTGIYREMDVVLGCLDNVETRFAVNRQCWLAKTPWIDAGIYELAGHVSVFVPGQSACYQCGSSNEQQKAARQRYSCDAFKRAVIKEGKMPTVQISSAIVSAIQVQETIKLICGHPVASGKKIYFQGTVNDFDVLSLSHNPDCLAHAEFPRVVSLPLGTDCTLKEFIVMVSKSDYSGEGASLDFNGDMTASLSRTFIKSVSCRTCKKPIDFYRPSFRINENETICSSCQEGGNKEKDTTFDVESDKVSISRFNISATEDRVLNMTLRDIGVPYQHIVAVYDTGGVYQYYELAGDKNKILPEVTRDIIQITLDK